MQRRSRKPFALPYEPEYTAHRRDDHVRRVTRLHLNLRESVVAPSIVPQEPAVRGTRQTKKLVPVER